MSMRLALLAPIALAIALFACRMNDGPGGPIAPASGAVPSANAAGHGRQTICTPGVQCNDSCPQGGCGIVCQGGSSCSQTCAGGNCAQTCEIGSSCNFSCSGGYCLQRCVGASCRTTCSGRGCTLETGDPKAEPPAEQAPPGEAPPKE
jgi:hypothetical protein